jgi:hypothetical protein
VRVHLVDGTYELFRHFYGVPSHRNADGAEVAAVRGVLGSVLGLLGDGATHVGVATDHVIESFRNDLWPGYKTGDGVDADLWSQAWPLEHALAAMGVTVWPMVDVEADDALASAAAVAADDAAVEQVVICTPDKDLGQCVRGTTVVQLDRRKSLLIDEAGVVAKFGVPPASIPDYLALVGDSADGFPGLPGWGAKSAATVLARGPRRAEARGRAARRLRRRAALPAPRDAARRPVAARIGRRPPLAGPDGRVRVGLRGDRRADAPGAGRRARRRPLLNLAAGRPARRCCRRSAGRRAGTQLRYASRRWATSRTRTAPAASSIVYRTRYSPRLARQWPEYGLRNGAPTRLGSSASGPRMNSKQAQATASGRRSCS